MKRTLLSQEGVSTGFLLPETGVGFCQPLHSSMSVGQALEGDKEDHVRVGEYSVDCIDGLNTVYMALPKKSDPD